MVRKSPALIVVLLFWLIYFQPSLAISRDSNLQADLVVILNTNPDDPLRAEIWLMNLRGELVKRITKNRYYEEYPKFSPDGGKISFVRNVGKPVPGIGIDPKYNEILIYDLRTGQEKRLTRNEAASAE